MSTTTTPSTPPQVAINADTATGFEAIAIINATARYNALQIKQNSAFVPLTPEQFFAQQIAQLKNGHVSSEINIRVNDPKQKGNIMALMGTPANKLPELVAVANTLTTAPAS
jgi:hypothetical protein